LKKSNPSKKTRKPEDPNAATEASRYENPIASREVILRVLDESGELFQLSGLASKLKLSSDQDLEALRRRVMAMRRDGQLHLDRRGRIGLTERLELQTCRVIGHRDGYGFATPVEGGDDLYLSSREMQKVFDGDRTLVATVGADAKGRREGKVVEVLERAVSVLPGRYMEESGIGFLMPYNTRVSQHILIPPDQKQGAVPGQMVSVRITDYPTQVLGAKGSVEEILGDHLDPGLEIDIAIRAHQIPWQWPDAVLDEAASLGEEPEDNDKRGRIDLRTKPFVTIDGEDARDFDDAVYCQPEGSGFRLWVAIADVSHYVAKDSALDLEAIERGNSVYFPERVVPMFPEVLSNGLCSLKPKVDRLAMVCEMAISAKGEVVGSTFYEAVIHSHARLTYTEVGQVLENGFADSVAPERYPDLMHLHALYGCLRGARELRGAIDFETVETRIEFNAERKIEAIVPVHRNDAHKLIEECMLAANVATAEFLEAASLPVLFRVHEGPSTERLANVRAFLGELGLDLGGGEKPTPEDYQRLLATAVDRDDASVIQTMLLRSLSQAVYQAENKGHFGLHYPAYAHFTCEFLRDRVGEQFSGVITAVTAFGIFVELSDLYIEGLVHISALPGDYYHFDAPKQRLVGDRTRRTFQLGGPVEVTVARVDLDERKIDLEMVGASNARPARGRKGTGSTGKKKSAAGKHHQRESPSKAGKKSTGQAHSKDSKAKAGGGAPKKQGGKPRSNGNKPGRSKR
jgi:ribonuclease R